MRAGITRPAMARSIKGAAAMAARHHIAGRRIAPDRRHTVPSHSSSIAKATRSRAASGPSKGSWMVRSTVGPSQMCSNARSTAGGGVSARMSRKFTRAPVVRLNESGVARSQAASTRSSIA